MEETDLKKKKKNTKLCEEMRDEEWVKVVNGREKDSLIKIQRRYCQVYHQNQTTHGGHKKEMQKRWRTVSVMWKCVEEMRLKTKKCER